MWGSAYFCRRSLSFDSANFLDEISIPLDAVEDDLLVESGVRLCASPESVIWKGIGNGPVAEPIQYARPSLACDPSPAAGQLSKRKHSSRRRIR
jgi:hypothetical protein